MGTRKCDLHQQEVTLVVSLLHSSLTENNCDTYVHVSSAKISNVVMSFIMLIIINPVSAFGNCYTEIF